MFKQTLLGSRGGAIYKKVSANGSELSSLQRQHFKEDKGFLGSSYRFDKLYQNTFPN